MDEKRKIPYGVINWATLVRECFLVDNTAHIRELEKSMTPVFLRPKRFGKSIVCSMLALYNSTICNWYLFHFVSCKGRQPQFVIDANVRTDIGWFRRLTQTNEKALAKLRAYVERGEGEIVSTTALSAKFGRAKFFTDEFFPYALYYLGLLTFEDEFTLNIPNLTIRNMFVDYYDELSEWKNVDEAAYKNIL